MSEVYRKLSSNKNFGISKVMKRKGEIEMFLKSDLV